MLHLQGVPEIRVFFAKLFLLILRQLPKMIPLSCFAGAILYPAAHPHDDGCQDTGERENDASRYTRYVARAVALRERNRRDDSAQLSETARKGGESTTLGRSHDLIYTAIIREHV